MDYKDTLNMPKTSFEMRGNLGTREPLFQKEWYDNNLYQERLKKNEGHKTFILHDGPPYANGNIHVGHALNKILKDIIVRYKSMDGFYSPFIPGWDTHGLPIETAISKTGVNRKTMSTGDFRKLCYDYALKQVAKQKDQFKRLGVLGSWDDPYITLQPHYEAEQIRVFAKMADLGLIFKGLKPVYWSPSSESALAEAEIEYQDKKDATIFVKMNVVDGNGLIPNDSSLIIWTTTPWTIPGNLAICAGPDIEYGLVKFDSLQYVCAIELIEKLKEEFKVETTEVVKTFKGRDLLGVTYEHPIAKRVQPVINADYVTTTDGTGLVHIAPAFGEDDFNVGREYNIGMLNYIDEKGMMTAEAGEFAGLFYEDGNKAVITKLNEVNALLSVKNVIHSYPHDWRTKKPVIFRATAQWFASIDKLKDTLLEEIKNVEWFPNWGELRISNMIKDRKDWCISRQRAWGVPIPIFYAEDQTEILDQEVFAHVANLFEKHGSQIWFEKTANELLPEGYTNVHSPNGLFTKETDIMDVWFDSGSSHQAVLKHYNIEYPADLYLEGSDQYRGWFNSSIITGVAVTNKAPYRQVLSHGWVLDEKGEKMSKSLGNTVDPNKVCNQMGADILRLWTSSIEYTGDVRIGDAILKQVTESYRKVRNTFKFMLANISDFDPKVNYVETSKLANVDKYMLCKLNNFVISVRKAYESYSFTEAYRLINGFISSLLSPFYLDFTKDILYIEDVDSLSRRSVQTVYYETMLVLLKVLTPIIPHTTSEAYKAMPGDKESDVYLLDMAKPIDLSQYKNIENDFDQFVEFRNDVLKALEEARNNKVIGKSFNAHLFISPSKELSELITRLNVNLSQVLIVSKLTLKEVSPETKIEVFAAEGKTCARCWQIVDELLENELCPRCNGVVNK